jgi:5-hydroxyisourate hydrolase
MAGLTTHVLDTMRGRPASGVAIELHALAPDGGRALVASVRTNADGRTDAPLIAAAQARAGAFELSFHVGAYFRAAGVALADPPFLDIVPIRFAIADPQAHYHVPLVVTPWSYSTYRGS